MRFLYKLLIFLFISIIVIFVYVLWLLNKNQIIDGNESISFKVQSGDSVARITQKLEDLGVIKNPWLFKKYMAWSNLDTKIKAGTVNLNNPFSIRHIADVLSSSRADVKSITILPGWDLREIAEYLSSEGFGTDADILKLTGNSATIRSRGNLTPEGELIKKKPIDVSFEGYLAPDTYEVYTDSTAEEILNKFFEHRNSQFTSQMYRDIERSGRTVHEILTMASIIEREVRDGKDRKIVSAIFWKRYDNGWPLQADSTVHYLLNKKGNVFTTANDRLTDSPWNTYKYKEMPPGPISSPSLNSIMAAIYPENNPYWFFLTTSDGRVLYAKTLEEHNENKVHM